MKRRIDWISARPPLERSKPRSRSIVPGLQGRLLYPLLLHGNKHINHINKKNQNHSAIKQVKNIFNTDSFKTLYCALIHPHINYGILEWGNAAKCILKCAVVLQKWATRNIYKVQHNSHTEPRFRTLRSLKIKDQSENEITLFMNKYKQKKLLNVPLIKVLTYYLDVDCGLITRQ